MTKAGDEKQHKTHGKTAKHEDDAEEDGDVAKGKLAQLRPKRRVFLFLAFLAVNVWFAVVYDPCSSAKKKKSRDDCGWSGVTSFTCQTGACFMHPGKADKLNVQVSVASGQKLGLKVTKSSSTPPEVTIKEITASGSVASHNSNQTASDLTIQVGDRIVKVNGHTGANIQAELARKKPSAKFELLRPASAVARNVPTFLSDSIAGQVLKSRGFEHWLESFSKLGGVGVFTWFLSGYPVASLPVYYLGVSAMTSWYMVKCCHDEKPSKQGDPHCFFNGVADLKTAVGMAVNQTTRKRALKFFGWVP